MDDLFERLEGLLAKATPPPWEIDERRTTVLIPYRGPHHRAAAYAGTLSNATLIVEAINALPTLLAEITRLEALVARQREAGNDLADATRSTVDCGRYPSLTEALAEWDFVARQALEDHTQ